MRPPLKLLPLLAALALLVAAPLLASGGPLAQSDQRLRVVTSTVVLADFIQQVGGDRVDVLTIVPSGADPHTYQPTPGDVQRILGANVAIWNGLGFDEQAEHLVDAQNIRNLTVVTLAEGIEAIGELHEGHEGETLEEHAAHVGADAGEHADEGEHGHAAGNPHLWLDPTLAMRYVRTIRDTLAAADPANASVYEANAARYLAQLAELDAWALQQVAEIPVERRKLVTFHDAFPYLARHFGLELVGVVLRSPGREPSAQEIAALVTELQTAGIPTVYAEPQFNARVVELAARDAGVQVKRIYSDTFDDQVGSYLDLMRFNVAALVEGLR
ncbi:MAG: metal ABC transporter substrate-binding protein [Chloroflexota bacterium]|nr:metal ABC transporter substrate-binding protein [Chloroflexota bacterium]